MTNKFSNSISSSTNVTPRITPRVLIVSDHIGKQMSICLRELLPHNFSVSALIKSHDTHENIIKAVKEQVNSFTKSDHIIVMLSSYHVASNK